MPTEVLRRAQSEMLSLGNGGMSVMEISHRSKAFERINDDARQKIKNLLALPDNYQVLFMQGGATLQFTLVPMNFLPDGALADYVVTGAWGKKAVKEAANHGDARKIYDGEPRKFTTVPTPDELNFDEKAVFAHYTSNETIDGVEFDYDVDARQIPLVCDASSNIMSKPIDARKYALIYAGAQKNLGPSGVTIVIVRADLLAESAPRKIPPTLDYREFAAHDSLLNTPNTWGIYLIDLVCDWLVEQGGLQAMQQKNQAKAQILYDAIDAGDFYQGHAAKSARSLMNVTFRLPTADLEQKFCREAAENQMDGLTGHRSVGGVRASIYNAFPREGVEKLVEFMREFERKNG